ncbi:Outer membrane protein (porin) [Polaromonas sp. CG9_12]|uniref:porin n=1 Tax=Polaromonas sp. CG_9.11 TaxID=2787730 RepID=UPI0004DDD07C|nr:porin [Polaromonas sp. CG_9.11]MBG6077258.1 putative porin [Polaromonas sp. CG_9.11]CDS50862.1 Outer membrane protein (porin) [Polaromonas sp. CG9_12]
MKLALITLAALITCGTSMAQSTVTLYGIADAYFGQKQSGVGATKLKRTVVDSDGMANSRWGLRGSEDLGGGLKAEFQFESLFDITNGATTQVTTVPAAVAPQLFSSQAWVGISGRFGNVKLGRQVSPFHSFVGLTNNLYDATAFSTTGTVWGLGSLPNYVGRFDNSVSYESPIFIGFSGKVAMGFGENKALATPTTPDLSAARNTSLNIKYAKGPLVAGYSFQEQKPQGSAPALKYSLLGGSYDFGVAKVVGAVNTARRDSAKDNEWQLGVNIPFGAASVAVGYGIAKGHVNGAAGNKGTGLALLGTYDLSKRSRLYAGWRTTTAKNASGATTNETSTIGAGMIHRF